MASRGLATFSLWISRDYARRSRQKAAREEVGPQGERAHFVLSVRSFECPVNKPSPQTAGAFLRLVKSDLS